MLIFGAHMSIAGGFAQAAEKTANELHCNAMQIFTKSPRGGRMKPVNPLDAAEFRTLCQKHKITYVIAHSSYLLNFGKPLSQNPWALENIKADFERLHLLGGHGVVVHIGKSLDGDRAAAVKNVIENAKRVLHETEKISLANHKKYSRPLQYILENTAGQGTEIGFRLEELAQIWKGLKGFSPRLKSCIDTAHVWAAGYDISTKKAVTIFLKLYEELIGLKTISCFHFNDSKHPLESHLDRHENIGDGKIALEGLAAIAKFAQTNSVPLILETPEKGDKTHLDDVKKLKSLVR